MKKLTLIAIFSLFLPGVIAQSSLTFTSSATTFYSWFPIILIGIFLSMMIAIVLYVLASIINNNRLKQMALGEFSQVIGTVLIIVIIILALNMYGTAIYQSDPQLVSSVSQICSSSQLGSSPFNLTNSMPPIANPSNLGPTAEICSGLINPASAGSTDITTNIDYGLAATYVIAANLTTQSMLNINAINVFDNWYGTLSSLNVTENVCYPATCFESPAVVPFGPAAWNATYSFMPFNLYGKLRGGTLFFGGEAQIVAYLGILELIAIIIMLFGWPYLLAAGIVLRSSFLTRRAGGLILSIVLVGLFLFPMLNMFEYAALTNANNPLSPIGISPIVNGANPYNSLNVMGLPFASTTPQTIPIPNVNNVPETTITAKGAITYGAGHFNMYVYPNLAYVLNYDGCWPTRSSIELADLEIYGAYITPGVSLLLAAKDFLSTIPSLGGIPSPGTSLLSGFSCDPASILNSIFDISNVYGMIFVTGVLLNVLNILILLSAVKGISSLLGGDTSLLGIGRLI